LEESLAEIQNKLGPKFKIPTMLLKIKKNKHKNKILEVKPKSSHKYMHSPIARPTKQI